MAVLGDIVMVVQFDTKELFSLIQSCLALASAPLLKLRTINLSMAVCRKK